MGKSKAKTYEGTLKKLTKIAAVGIMVLAIALVLLQVYVMPNVKTNQTPSATPVVTVSESPEASASVSPEAS